MSLPTCPGSTSVGSLIFIRGCENRVGRIPLSAPVPIGARVHGAAVPIIVAGTAVAVAAVAAAPEEAQGACIGSPVASDGGAGLVVDIVVFVVVFVVVVVGLLVAMEGLDMLSLTGGVDDEEGASGSRSQLNRVPNRKCCTTGSLLSTSALYILIIPLLIFAHPPLTPEMSYSIGECSQNGPFFTS